MRQGYSRVIVLIMVVAVLSVPHGKAQDAGPSGGEAQREVLERQSVGLEETLTLAVAHATAGQFTEGQQLLETALGVLSTPEAQHALRLALADLHAAWARSWSSVLPTRTPGRSIRLPSRSAGPSGIGLGKGPSWIGSAPRTGPRASTERQSHTLSKPWGCSVRSQSGPGRASR